MKRLATIALLGLATAGCIPQVTPPGTAPVTRPNTPAPPPTDRPAPGRPAPGMREPIEYQTGPCFGRCPVYRLHLEPNGQAVFTGIRFTAVTGERRFRIDPAEAAAFANALAPYRPATGTTRRYSHGEPGCEQAATDLPSAEVRWRGRRATTTLYYYFGCNGDASRAMADAIGNAPDLIPELAPLLGPRP